MSGASQAEQIDAVVADSRVLSSVFRMMGAPLAAWPASNARRVLAPFLNLDVTAKVSAAGSALAVAALVHAVATMALGVPVYAIGWSVRVVLFVAGVLFSRRPDTLAAAWKSKTGELPRSY